MSSAAKAIKSSRPWVNIRVTQMLNHLDFSYGIISWSPREFCMTWLITNRRVSMLNFFSARYRLKLFARERFTVFFLKGVFPFFRNLRKPPITLWESGTVSAYDPSKCSVSEKSPHRRRGRRDNLLDDDVLIPFFHLIDSRSKNEDGFFNNIFKLTPYISWIYKTLTSHSTSMITRHFTFFLISKRKLIDKRSSTHSTMPKNANLWKSAMKADTHADNMK